LGTVLVHISTIARPLVALGMLTVLSACAVYSSAALIDESEATAPLGDGFAVLFYDETPEGYVRDTEGEAMTYVATDTTYQAAGESMKVRFVPRGPGKYLVAVETTEGYVYGIAALGANNVVEMHLALEGDIVAPVESKLVGAPPEIAAGITAAAGGVEVLSRAGLDFMIGMLEAGEIGKKPMIGYVAASEAGPFPALIRKDGDAWVITD
jgi:hypothetical protein